MKKLKDIDAESQTVLMVQVENEIGFLKSDRDYSKEAEKQLKKMGISLDDLNIVATIENPEAIKRSVKSGLGITIISRLAAADEIQAGEVLEFPFSQDGSGRNLNLVYNKNYKLPAAAEHVRELIIEKYELQKQSLQ